MRKGLVTYASRIPADAGYLSALGRAFYNFTYLVWIVVSTIARFSPRGCAAVPQGQTARTIARALLRAIDEASPPLAPAVRRDLLQVHERHLQVIRVRNKLLHAHPFTAEDGSQRLSAGCRPWSTEAVDDAAQHFERLRELKTGSMTGSGCIEMSGASFCTWRQRMGTLVSGLTKTR